MRLTPSPRVHTPCSCCGTGGGRASRCAQPQWLHLWLHSPAISKARERSRPRLRPAHTAGVVIADRWVDDLESERVARHRGFESLHFRPSTSTKHRYIDHLSAQCGRRWLHFWWYSSHQVTRLTGSSTRWSRCAVDGLWRMQNLAPHGWRHARRHGLSADGGRVCLVSGGSGPECCRVWPLRPCSGAVTMVRRVDALGRQ
jgi:hypothetical protein